MPPKQFSLQRNQLRSMGSTLRSKSRPLGRRDSRKVQEGNVMVARCMILCLLASARACWWILEQPGSSIMHHHPTFQKALRLLRGVRRLRLCMRNYGGKTKKATVLFSRNLDICQNTFSRIRQAPNKNTHTKPSLSSSKHSKEIEGFDLFLSLIHI